jgi:predicted phosphoribosyltransferase
MSSIVEIPDLRNRTGVFQDREEAGLYLAKALEEFRGQDAIILAIPSGGVPIGLTVRSYLQLPLDLLIIRKIPIPGNPEAGFGALSLEGDMVLNEGLVHRLRLSSREIEEEAELVRMELERRNHLFREDRPWPRLKGRIVIMIDDGLASGYTMMAAAIMVRRHDPSQIIVAVPTAPLQTLERIETYVDKIVCLNIRTESRFAVAESYRNWYDLSSEEVLYLLRKHGLIGMGDAK